MINQLLKEISPLSKSIENHSLYAKTKTQKDLCFFMERHVFVVLG